MMYISNEPQSNGQPATKYASTNSIPSLVDENLRFSSSVGATGKKEGFAILRDNKARRHSVLEDLKARRDSLFQRARRSSVIEEKENSKLQQAIQGIPPIPPTKEKRRSSESTSRRGSVFYVSNDLLEENKDVLAAEDRRIQADYETKKSRRKSWHPLGKPPKLDRKRRKGVAGVPTQTGSTEVLYTQARQKRPS